MQTARLTACTAQRPVQQTQQQPAKQRTLAPGNRRQLLGGLAGLALLGGAAAGPRPAPALGLESIEMPSLDVPQAVRQLQQRNQASLDAAEEKFQNSELLRTLKERSEANAPRRKKEMLDLYCRRQAEMGVGDCAGLRLIPGMTKSGVQKRPELLNKLFGTPEQE